MRHMDVQLKANYYNRKGKLLQLSCVAPPTNWKQQVILILTARKLLVSQTNFVYLTGIFFQLCSMSTFRYSNFPYCLQDCRCVKYTKLVSLRNKLQCIHLPTSLLWLTTIERQVCASLNRCKRMKAEPSRQIPHKLAAKLELVLLLQYVTTYHAWNVAKPCPAYSWFNIHIKSFCNLYCCTVS